MIPEELREKYQSIRHGIDALAGLDDIDWSQLEHAHGKASDFPALVNAALSENARDREFAMILLHETIWHQGKVYQATAHTVSFIAALAQSPEVSNKTDFAMLLAALARGKGYFDREFDSEQDREMWRKVLARNGQDLVVSQKVDIWDEADFNMEAQLS